MSYKLTTGWPQHVETGAFVNPETNAEYVAWIAEGNTPLPYVAPPTPVPTSISPRQIRQALTRKGLRAAVEAAVAAGDQDIKDWWEFSTVCERDNEHVISMATALGVTDAQLDDLWTLGATL